MFVTTGKNAFFSWIATHTVPILSDMQSLVLQSDCGSYLKILSSIFLEFVPEEVTLFSLSLSYCLRGTLIGSHSVASQRVHKAHTEQAASN